MLLVIAALCLAGCKANRSRTPDDTLVMVIDGVMSSYDPRYAKTNYDAKLTRLIAPGLTTVDTADAMPQLALAKSVEKVDDRTIDVVLRDDVLFSDGQPVRAEDVARTYMTVMDDKCSSLYQGPFLERFVSIEAIDAKRVRFHLKQTVAMFMSDIEFGVISFYGVKPGECRPKKIIGAGPFIVRSLTAAGVMLDANPYYRPKPKMQHVQIKVVRDPAARILMLVGGSADLIQNGVRPDLVDDVLKRPRVKKDVGASVILTYMLINNTDKALADKRVRQALAYAIDRDELIAAEFGNRAVPATGLLPPTHWAYNPDVRRYPRDVAKAKALLDEAGYKPDARGVRLHLVYKTSADAFRVTLARVIAAQLGEAGIEVEVRSFEFGTFFADIKKGNYQIATMQSPEITEPDFYFWFFHSSRWPSDKDPDGSNRWRYKNPEMDRLVEAGRAEMDPQKRKPIYADAQRLAAEELPIIPLWHEDNVVLSNRTVTGYQIVPNARFVGLIGTSKSP
jgi:peptide/nickel transport system substrate-binding protein